MRGKKHPICWLAAAGACALLTLGPVHAADSSTNTSELSTGIELKALKQQLDRSRSQASDIEGQLSTLGKEQEELSRRLAEVASRIQSREAMITSGEQRLGALDAEEKALLDDLRRRRKALAELLAGLQRLERNPPPPLATHPDDALGALRGAMLFGAVVPELRNQTASLNQSLARLNEVRAAQGAEQDEIAGHIARLSAERAELVALQERKKALIAETEGRLKTEQERARTLASRAKSLEQLLDGLVKARLAQEAEERKRAEVEAAEAQRQAEAQAAEARKQADAQAAQELEEQKRAEAEERRRIALLSKPRVAFSRLRGRLDYPAQGQRVREYGDKDGFGGETRGLFIATRAEAQVTAPADAKVEFAGEFRSYGLLLILDVGEGYHLLMAGLGTVTAETGQTVRAGEPVGSMGQRAASGTLIGDRLDDPRPILYVEFRKDGGAIDPSAWWVDSRKEARR